MSEVRACCRGFLGVAKKKGTERRYFILYEGHPGHLEYHATQKDAEEGKKPRGRITLLEVEKISTPDDTRLTLHTISGAVTLVADTADEIKPWATNMQLLLTPDPTASTSTIDTKMPGAQTVMSAATTVAPEDEVDDSDEDAEEDGESEEGEDGGEDAEGKDADQDAEEHDEPEEQLEDEIGEDIWHQGNLNVLRKGKWSGRYFAMTDAALEYYGSLEDFENAKDRRGFIPQDSILRVERGGSSSSGFLLHLMDVDKPFELQAPSQKEAEEWLSMFPRWLRRSEWQAIGDDLRETAIQDVFRCLDKGRAGYLSPASMLSVARLLGFKGTEQEWAGEWLSICEGFSVDVNSGLSIQQFNEFVSSENNRTDTAALVQLAVDLRTHSVAEGSRKSETRQACIKSLFDLFDDNGSGYVTCIELLSYVRYCGFSNSEKEWEKQFGTICRRLGADPARGLSLAQFTAFLEDDTNYTKTSELRQITKSLEADKVNDAGDRRKTAEQASRIQAAFRGHLARREQAERAKAAKAIQDAARRRQSRKADEKPKAKVQRRPASPPISPRPHFHRSTGKGPIRPDAALPPGTPQSIAMSRQRLEQAKEYLEKRMRVLNLDQEKSMRKQAAHGSHTEQQRARAQSLRQERDKLRQVRTEDVKLFKARARKNVLEASERLHMVKQKRFGLEVASGVSSRAQSPIPGSPRRAPRVLSVEATRTRRGFVSQMQQDGLATSKLAAELEKLQKQVAAQEQARERAVRKKEALSSYSPPFR